MSGLDRYLIECDALGKEKARDMFTQQYGVEVSFYVVLDDEGDVIVRRTMMTRSN